MTKDVPAHALVAGVPAKQTGWVCECGQVLKQDLYCSACKRRYKMEGCSLIEEKTSMNAEAGI